MTFTSFEFLLVLPLVVALYRVCPVGLRTPFLLILSYAFYCTWSVKGAVALALATVLTFFAGKRIGNVKSAHRTHITAAFAIVLLTAYLVFFKTAAVVPLGGMGRLIMPLGVSYYTFKLLSYVIDIYWGTLQHEPRLMSFATSVAFFPQIVAGPIQRPANFLRQLPPVRTSLSKGMPRLVLGLAKKVLVADQLAPAMTYIFSHINGLGGAPLLAGFYFFPLQLYADFSALTDIALGIGLMFGIEGPENFNRPSTASSPSDFWRRWHMTLTNWLADYVFTPLRMATRTAGNIGLAFSITVNMLAIGLWHGLTWGCLVFGLCNAGYLVADALTVRGRGRFFKAYPHLDWLGNWVGWFFTFHLVALGLLFFRTSTLSDALWLLSHSFTNLGATKSDLVRMTSAVGSSLKLGLVGYSILELGERFRPHEWWQRLEPRVPPWLQWPVRACIALMLAIGLFLLTVRASGHQNPFLYQLF